MCNLSYGSVQRILTKMLKLHPYKVKLVQELNDDDPDRRVQFAELMMNRMDDDTNFLKRICVFSDEATFFLNGSINRHNMSH